MSKISEQMALEDYGRMYDVSFYCRNCGKHFKKWFEKGASARTVKCPKCECLVEP